MSFPAYPAYKNTGIEWLGQIPDHWSVKPVWSLASCNDEVLGEDTDADLLLDYVEISDVEASRGIFASTELRFADAPSRARRKVQDGDVIVSTVRTYLRAVAPVKQPSPSMVVSTGFAVMRPKHVVPGFLAYLFQAEFLISEIIRRSVGVSYPAINASEISRLRVALPPEREQRVVVAFLDCECAKIDVLIAEQECLMALLEEKRLANTSQAVTCGLNAGSKTKGSGIPWLGAIPAHWEIARAKALFRQSDLPPPEGAEVVTCFRDGRVTLRRNRREDGFMVALLEAGYQGVKVGQLVLHSMDAFAGAIGVSDSGGKCSPEYIVCDPKRDDVDPGYFARLLRVMARRGFILAACPSVRERAPRIRFPGFGDMLLPVPPLDEQRRIAEAISCDESTITALHQECRSAVALLKERRAALISASVTGEIDLRGLISVAEAA